MKTPALGAVLPAILLHLWAAVVYGADPVDRHPARPLAEHPGNVFLADENVTLSLPAGGGVWRVVDYDERPVAAPPPGTAIDLKRLPVGYYEIRRDDGAVRTISFGVLEPLRAPPPESSPIGVDVAMAWFYPATKMPTVASLCALAGMSWVRDRLSWAEMEPRRGALLAQSRYDASAVAQSAAGLQVLQVNHSSPGWAGPDHKRFAPDLRDVHRFYRAMAARWQAQVPAFEPWNEADIPQFGGHTGAEMASFQKAAYLGLKAGNPQVIACQNVFAIAQPDILEDFHANEAWPYFDTFNLHHYAAVDRYPGIYAQFRAVSAGRPLWVSECNVPVKWSGDAKLKEPSPADLRVQSERVAKVVAGTLHEGSAATFYFLLPHYVEGQTQFGVLRPDLTPRPAYVALAAVGRLLADARPLGKLRGDGGIRGFAFAALPDGKEHVVLAAWNDAGKTAYPLPARPVAVFDHLGRVAPAPGERIELSAAPVFLLFAAGAEKQLALESPPAPVARLEGKPSPVVLQSVWPVERVARGESAYKVSGQASEPIPIFVYNFGSAPVEGRLTASGPEGWKLVLPEQVRLAADERRELALACTAPAGSGRAKITIRGDFGPAGRAVLSLQLLPMPKK